MDEKIIKMKNTVKKILNKMQNKKKLYASVAVLLVVAILVAGLSYAWFFQKMDMATLLKIEEPTNIAILGPGGKEKAALDLSYTASDKDADNKVTIKRVICVRSEADKFQLEIVHTTNLKGLEFKLYPATSVSEGSQEENITEDGYTYAYNSSDVIDGTYINVDKSENSYRYANGKKHNENYGLSEETDRGYDNVQVHAEPVYWLANGDGSTDSSNNFQANKNDDITIKENLLHRTYFVCEISWTETTKETDIFYILAKTS